MRCALCVTVASACATQASAPTVAFKYDAPFCGRSLIEKSVDHGVVEVDSMTSGMTSRTFAVTPGTHVLSARRVNLIAGQTTTNYSWPDTTVSLKAGESLTRVLQLYCS